MKLWSENAKENKLGGRSEVPIGLDNNIEFLIHFYEYQARPPRPRPCLDFAE